MSSLSTTPPATPPAALTIGALAKLTGVKVPTIRYYRNAP